MTAATLANPQPQTPPLAVAEEPPAASPIVRLDDVYKAFGSLKVLDGVTLDIERGKTTVILGPSGTGKSVLLKHIVGLLHPDRGSVFFDDERIGDMQEQQLVAMRKKVGFLFQMGALFDSMSNEQNIEFPLIEHTDMKRDDRREAVARVLKLVGLDGIQKKMPADVSGGQRKRVALARAIVLEPKLVLYDEPTTGLDPIRADVINELICSLTTRLGISSIVVNARHAECEQIADRMVLLYQGRIVCDGTPEAFRKSDNQLVQRFIHGQADDEDLAAIRDGFEHAGTRGTGIGERGPEGAGFGGLGEQGSGSELHDTRRT